MSTTSSTPVKGSTRLIQFILAAALLVAAAFGGFKLASWISELRVETVFPTAPALVAAPECDLEPTVSIPETKGVSYDQTRSGAELTVEAIPQEGYRLTEGADSNWNFDLTAVPCPVDEADSASSKATPDYVGELIEGAKDVGSDAWDWTKEYGPGIWDRIKELGTDARESVESWSRG